MKTVLTVFGTRPEAIKMCPLIKELKGHGNFKTPVCVTGQHREMLYSVLDELGVTADYDLSVMTDGQTPLEVTSEILREIGSVLDKTRPDVVLVHGDTTTAFAAALACFYKRISVGHVEAGLRTYDIYSPYPEEFNRQAISKIAKYNFAPTDTARQNLLREGVSEQSIFLTGNTIIDALKITVRAEFTHPLFEWASGSRLAVVTAHRRESIGEPMKRMLRGVRRAIEETPDVKVIYPMHKNPKARAIAKKELGDSERICLVEPLGVIDFHNILARSHIIITDSGGIQEEAVALGKPTLVMRSTTERPEGIDAGTLKLVGTDEVAVYKSVKLLLERNDLYSKMAKAKASYGDGTAARQIADIIEENIS